MNDLTGSLDKELVEGAPALTRLLWAVRVEGAGAAGPGYE